MGGWFGGGGGSSPAPVASVDPAIAESKKKTEDAEAASINKKGRPVTPTTYGGDMLGGGGVMPKPDGNNAASLVRKVLLGQ